MFEFHHPLWLLLLIPVLGVGWQMLARRQRRAIRFAPTARLPRQGRSWRTRAALLPPILYTLALVLTVIALARPRSLLSYSRRTTNAMAIQMVVDVSGSMEALDMSVMTAGELKEQTRLDVVKDTFATFVESRPDDLIGLISFGGYTSTLAPLTADHRALLHILEGVSIPPLMFDRGGQVLNQEELLTAIGDALSTACARLENVETASKIIVLLSDGDSNAGVIEPETAMEMARRMGIKVYTIGVGSSGRAPYRTRDALGREVIRHAWIDFDETLLRKIAGQTEGVYYNVTDAKGLDQALASINELETTEVEQSVYREYEELFFRAAAPALGLLLLGVCLNMLIARRLI